MLITFSTLGQIPHDCTEDRLRAAIAAATDNAPFAKLELKFGKGYAFVTYFNHQAADEALRRLTGATPLILYGNAVIVQMAQVRRRKLGASQERI